MGANYDFSGYVTKNDLKCSDGRTIRKNAFKECDGKRVPLVWQHMHDDPSNVIGHMILENREDGVFGYGYLNDTEKGQTSKAIIDHGDVCSLSIYANKLKQKGGDVLHGVIREVSLVLAGANPGAFIDFPILAHGEESETEATIYTGEPIYLEHSKKDEDEEEEKQEDEDQKSEEDSDEKADEEETPEDNKESDEEEDEKKKKKEKTMAHADGNGKTVKDVFEELTEEQKNVVYFMIGQALEDAGVSGGEDDKEMKHNVFDQEYERQDVLSHSDMMDIIEMAKKPSVGTFQTAMEYFAADNGLELQHDDSDTPAWYPPAPVGGFYQTPPQTGDLTVEALFPDYKDIGQPWNNIITNDQGWIDQVMRKVAKSPISRVRTGQVDIRNIDALRAKGYQKGSFKKYTGNFKLVRRTTDPQTVYVKNALHRDDIVDITDFDYVQYLYNIDKLMMNEELATAFLFGDGRDDTDEDKIDPNHIRPIWLDDELYTLHKDIDMDAAREELQGTETDSYFGENFIRAEAMINACLYAREDYKGSGTPDMFIHPHELNVMLLARDRNGRRIYSSKAELASAFNVGNVYTVEQMLNKTRTAGNKTKKLLSLIVNLNDYQVGSTKGGELTHFTQFDIDFNQEKSLLETRLSGALIKCWSAIAIEEDVTE